MVLELRCPRHPYYLGEHKPGGDLAVNDDHAGGSLCADCWELFRLKHESKGPRRL